MKGCKVERSKFIRVDTIWRILETQNGSWGTSKWSDWWSKCFRWSQVYPRGAQVRPKGGQGTPRWSQEKPQGAPGDPKRAQDDPKGSPRGAQSEPKRFTRGEGGCPRAPKHEKVNCSKSLSNRQIVYQQCIPDGQFCAMLAHVVSSWVHVVAFRVIIVP